MPALSPTERSLIGRLGAHERWSRCPDRAAATSPARRAFEARFERQVDPAGLMSPADRARAVENARSAYYTRLALASAQARRRAS